MKQYYLQKKALKVDPNYADYNYRKEQLWGKKLQRATEELLNKEELIKEVMSAKTKIQNAY